ncbi:MAG: hypothetical protein ABL864_14580, partial [Terricaulis sp.]
GQGDSLIGADLIANRLDGGGGNDFLFGLSGDDTLIGASGVDQLNGGDGDDTFVFRAGQANGDVVIDFSGNGAGAGDMFLFEGYGTVALGAAFTQIDATHWRVTSDDGLFVETITVANGNGVDPSDYIFAGG